MKLHRTTSPIETLEARIAPAGIITISADGRTATWDDIDGDKASLVITKGRLDAALFETDQTPATGLTVTKLNLTDVQFKGTSVTATAKRNPQVGGDGQVNIGYLDATGQPLLAVKVNGDLGRIDAGDPVLTPKTPKAIGTLTAFSMGMTEGDTLPAGVTQVSEIFGKVGTVKFRGNVKGVLFNVTGGLVNGINVGSIDALTIGGSLIGTDDADSGRISTSGKIGPIIVNGSLYGGGGQHSGSIEAGGNILSVLIGGSIFGGRSDNPSTDGTGVIRTDGTFGLVTVLGNIHGGSQQDSGLISSAGNAGAIKIAGGIVGGSAGASSGGIRVGGNAAGISVKGDVIGGAALDSGVIEVGGKAGAIAILGGLTGGDGDGSGRISIGTSSVDSVLALSIARDITGGSGEESGRVTSAGLITTFAVKGSIHGGGGEDSGSVLLGNGAGIASITGDIRGDAGDASGHLRATGKIAALAIGGSIIGGSADLTGSIISNAKIGTLSISGSLLGPDLPVTATADIQDSALIQAGGIGALTLAGTVRAGVDSSVAGELINTAAIRVANDIGALTIKRGIEGTEGNPVFITARGQELVPSDAFADFAFKTITITGGVRFANILAGYDTTTDATAAEANPNAQIGAVIVGGDWTASNLIAGVKWNDRFAAGGDVKATGLDNPRITALIGSIKISGSVYGTADNATDHYGFVAQAIKTMTIGAGAPAAPGTLAANAIFLADGKANDNDTVSLRYNLAPTMDVRIFEVA